MSLQILRELDLDKRLSGLERSIVEEFNMIINVLSQPEVGFTSASKYLEDKSFTYFSVLSLNEKIYVRQLNLGKGVVDSNILKKSYQ